MREWSAAPEARVRALLCIFSGALSEIVSDQSRRVTKKFARAVERVQQAISGLPLANRVLPDSSLRAASAKTLHFAVNCPVCYTPAGERQPDNYFTDWPHACGVQTANLLYETGLVFWAILLGLPHWASGSFLQQLNILRSEVRRAGKDMSLLECPQCGRLTTCLYGYPEPEKNGFCRWCLDMGGGLGLGFSVDFDAEGKPRIEMTKTDHTAPGRNAWDILPPEIARRINT